jgi:hypothetical protein
MAGQPYQLSMGTVQRRCSYIQAPNGRDTPSTAPMGMDSASTRQPLMRMVVQKAPQS